MTTKPTTFRRSKMFKIIVLVIYVYSFMQLETNGSPLQIEFINLDDPFQMKKIQLQVERPMKVLVKIFGKDTQTD